MTDLDFSPQELANLVAVFGAKGGVQTGNDSVEGMWRKIALSLEQGANLAPPAGANTTIQGSMYRAARAARAAWGGTGNFNTTPEGSLRSLLSAVETKAGAGSGTVKQRLAARAPLTSFP